jgi:hypothetical protein
MAVTSPRPGMLVRIDRRWKRVWSKAKSSRQSRSRAAICAWDLAQALRGLALQKRDRHDLRAIAAGGAVLHERPPGGDDLGQLIEHLALGLPGCGLQQRAEAGQHGGIDPVCLGQSAGRLGEAAGLARIDLGEGQPCGRKRALEAPVIGAGGLEHDPLDGLARKPVQQRLVPGLVIDHPSCRAARMQVDVEVVFGDVDARDLC